jgi:hypothetical protein
MKWEEDTNCDVISQRDLLVWIDFSGFSSGCYKYKYLCGRDKMEPYCTYSGFSSMCIHFTIHNSFSNKVKHVSAHINYI